MTGRILIRNEKCTGCRSCEIACSHHLRRSFQPSISGIEVVWNSKTGEMEILRRNGCDLCQNEETPLCAKYCAPRALEYLQEEG